MDNVVSMAKQETNQTDALMCIKRVLESKEITAAQIAKEISVAPATLSQVLNGKYTADPVAIIEKLEKWLRLRDRRAATPNVNPGFVMTKTAEQIITDITFAHAVAEDGIVVVYGSPGVGKTQALKRYKQDSNNVWLLFASPARSSITAFLYSLALEIGIMNPTKRKDDLSRAITSKLSGSEGVIIIDEAQHLSFEALEELRIIQEETSIPMVLSGNKKTYAKMTGGARTEDFAQLFSRIAKKRNINKVKQADVRAIAGAWGVHGEAERSLMIQISERPGGLRLLTKTLKLAAMYAQSNPITENVLRKSFAELDANE
ncbi:AAA family ATPase [Vibrio vulnificus]|nr:AAA family ATPase [Vibrio vulnificus]